MKNLKSKYHRLNLSLLYLLQCLMDEEIWHGGKVSWVKADGHT